MAAIDDPKTFGRARLSFADQHDIDEFLATLEKFERGEIGPDKWRAFRLVRGTYGQRQDGDVHMLRVKVPQGKLLGTLRQLYALATVAETYSRGFGHITTRQDHWIPPMTPRVAFVGPELLRAVPSFPPA